jgi:predicted porin
MLWVEGAANNGRVGDHGLSPSRLGVTGSASIAKDWSVGYMLELGVDDIGVSTRHSAMWVQAPVGKLTLGKTSMATDGISELSLANTNVANLPSALYGAVVDGDRRNVVRFDSPTLAGFVASVAWSQSDVYDAALRYTGELKDVRVAAAVGFASVLDVERFSGSASAMHVPTGIFLNVMAGRVRDADATALHFTAGIEKKWVEVGASTLYVEYGRFDLGGAVLNGWGIGAVQAVDSVAADVFASYRNIDGTSVVGIGSRIKF